MKFLLTAIALIFSATGVATSEQAITLDVELSIDGKLVSHPTVVLISGATASIESASEDGKGVYIEVTPTLQNKNAVSMKFVVSEIEEGKKTIVNKSTILSPLGETAKISQESATEDLKDSMFLAVTATL